MYIAIVCTAIMYIAISYIAKIMHIAIRYVDTLYVACSYNIQTHVFGYVLKCFGGMFWDVFWMLWGCFLDVLGVFSVWFRDVFWMIWGCFLDDLGMFSGRFGNVFWMFWGCLLDVLGMFSGGISQTKQHRLTHPCRVAVVSLLTQKQKINAHMNEK